MKKGNQLFWIYDTLTQVKKAPNIPSAIQDSNDIEDPTGLDNRKDEKCNSSR